VGAKGRKIAGADSAPPAPLTAPGGASVAAQAEPTPQAAAEAAKTDPRVADLEKKVQDLERLLTDPQAAEAVLAVTNTTAGPQATTAAPVQSPMTSPQSSPSAPPRASGRAPEPKGMFETRYSGAGGVALDAWLAEARRQVRYFTGFTPSEAVNWLVTGFAGSALDWWEEQIAKGKQATTPEQLYETLRMRYQPVLTDETARAELDVATQGAQSVDEYAARLHQLFSKVNTLHMKDKIHVFKRGLSAKLREKLAELAVQPTELEVVIQTAARIEGSSMAARKANTLAAASVEDGPALPTTVAELNAFVAAAVQRIAAPPPRYDSRRDRGANKRSPQLPMWKEVGLTEEEGRRRRDANVCMYCAVAGHIMRDCRDRQAGKPAKLN